MCLRKLEKECSCSSGERLERTTCTGLHLPVLAILPSTWVEFGSGQSQLNTSHRMEQVTCWSTQQQALQNQRPTLANIKSGQPMPGMHPCNRMHSPKRHSQVLLSRPISHSNKHQTQAPAQHISHLVNGSVWRGRQPCSMQHMQSPPRSGHLHQGLHHRVHLPLAANQQLSPLSSQLKVSRPCDDFVHLICQ